MSEELKHHGVKGMKWGVRRFQNSDGTLKKAGKTRARQNDNKKDKVTVKDRVNSVRREQSWAKALKDFDNMRPDEQKRKTSRARLENDFKRLSNTKNVGTTKDKQDYIKNRSEMSTKDLQQRVATLQMKDGMRQQVRQANKKTIDVGKKVIAIAAPLAVQYATTKAIDKDWLKTKLDPQTKTGDWDAIGKQAAKWVDELI